MIKNKQYRINKSEIPDNMPWVDVIKKVIGKNVIRWYISKIEEEYIAIEATLYTDNFSELNQSVEAEYYPQKSVVINLVPTGIGCSIGGYAGDATPTANLLATTVDYLVTNPNTVNASNFINLKENVVYAEGHSIDLFSQGMVNFYLPYANTVGLIIEKSESWKIDILFNIINAIRAIYGVNIIDPIITDERIYSRCIQNEVGAFVGTVDNPEVLLNASQELIQKGANAIAVTTNVQDLPSEMYARHFRGECPNPVGGVEAIISHLIMKKFKIPVAHAPLMNIKDLDLKENVVDARGAGEMASTSGLACILVGLHKAPQIKIQTNTRIADIVNVNNVLAVVIPATCLGGVPVLQAQKYNIPVIAVHENQTILDISQSKLKLNNVIEVTSYAEAAGIILALKNGINLASLSRPLETFLFKEK
ncbi:DUF3326 domain-containing protein [Roseofilum capinflatum]|uniref:DUF3326 domain-containing protein n=1 Tax=Roseofilum capinflatum BLCC-M114 TaxID=3022440 RepID=A0ABT7B5R1_9CYAN|nr:DUF3326 domain-containing protein [Roseofilum capinflatum]MDJ1174455.1 DUF3326 domain-containing protein [Roseofilum capinflatum BLCC-M114]